MSAAFQTWGIRFAVSGTVGRVRSRTQRGRTTWYVDLRPFGRIYSIPDPTGEGPIPILDRKTAEHVLNTVRQAYYTSNRSWAHAIAPWLAHSGPEMRVGPRWERFCARLAERVETGERSATYLRELHRYGRDGGYLDPIRALPVALVAYGHLEDLDRELVKRGLSAKTRSHVLASLRTFLRWCQLRGDLDQVPRFPTVTIPEYLPTTIEPEAQRSVLGAIHERRRGIFLVLAYHGLRPTESTRLNVSDLDFRSGVITVRYTKARRSRQVPASPELREWIEAHVERSGRLSGAPLFTNPTSRQPGKRWTLDALEDAWNAAARAVGVECSLYAGTKHSSATAARRRGVPLEVIQQALGHADRRSTERYARAAELAPVGVLSVPHVSLGQDPPASRQAKRKRIK